MCQSVRSILKPMSHPYVIGGVFVLRQSVKLKTIEFAVQTVVNHRMTSRPGKTAKAWMCVYASEYKNTLTHTLCTLICPERSKQHRLSAIKQRMRERQQNKLIKGEQVIEATKRKRTQRVKRYKRERMKKVEENIHLCPRVKGGHYTHEPLLHNNMSP